ncbi:18210_t:CDS:2, partial [Funneliformis geosporum]
MSQAFAIPAICPNYMSQLCLIYVPNVSSVPSMSHQCPISVLTMSHDNTGHGKRSVKDASMLIQRCLNIEYLDFSVTMALWNDELIIAIIKGSPNLRHLEIGHNDIGDEMNLDTLKKKCKAEKAFKEYEYVYGIVTIATDWYFILHSTKAIYYTSKTEYRISLTEDALKDSTDLCKNVRRILEVIVGLLKDRVTASEELANK